MSPVALRSTTAAGPGSRTGLAGACCALLASASTLAATHEVAIVGQAFEPEQVTIAVGDTVRWTNLSEGSHNVVADSSQFASGRPMGGRWTFTHAFGSSGEFPYYCQPHGGPGGSGMSGKVIVEGPVGSSFQINAGVAGSWFNPATSGQGILLETADELGVLSMAWFTWSAEGGTHHWLSGSGPFVGDTATITLFRSSGGRFNDPAPVQTEAIGSAQITFTDCTHATFLFELDEPLASGSIPLQRILPPNPGCMDANPAAAADAAAR